eukprot:9482608-Pyramimonas_sp.AAC.1
MHVRLAFVYSRVRARVKGSSERGYDGIGVQGEVRRTVRLLLLQAHALQETRYHVLAIPMLQTNPRLSAAGVIISQKGGPHSCDSAWRLVTPARAYAAYTRTMVAVHTKRLHAAVGQTGDTNGINSYTKPSVGAAPDCHRSYAARLSCELRVYDGNLFP